MLDTFRPLKKASHKVRLSPEFQADIEWWRHFLETFNRKCIIQHRQPVTHVYTDACQEGAGLVTDGDWAYLHWDLDAPAVKSMHINHKETMAIVAAVYRWAPQWENRHVVVFTDNVTTKAAVNRGACRDPVVMAFLRVVFWLSATYNFTLTCRHIAGTDNQRADSVSRLCHKGHFLYVYSLSTKGMPFHILTMLNTWWRHMSNLTLLFFCMQVSKLVPWNKNSITQWPASEQRILRYPPSDRTAHI